MALVQISKNVMVNTSSIDCIEFIQSISGSSEISITIGENRYVVTEDPKTVLTEIQKSLSIPEAMMKNNQFFGG